MQHIRVRFAPSPTGGLHIGGVRTALYNYLFAKKHKGTFILRIEDTDQNRFVEGAEDYILHALEWCGIAPDESPKHGGSFGPYRQSERKDIYKKYAWELVEKGKAYLAFDTPEELEALRQKFPDFKYNFSNRDQLKNSLTLSKAECKIKVENNEPFVIRFQSEPNQIIEFVDEIRGHIQFNTNELDDKILLKRDSFPTYHLAVIVDDYLMKISHVFRGEEWLPSYPIHHVLQEAFGWQEAKPKYLHLPLILKPQGNGKLSKRDAEQFHFPIFPMAWKNSHEGYKEAGFLPEGLLNFLASLGWNDGTTKDIYSLDELIQAFDIKHIQNSSARFDYERAKWVNHHHIQLNGTSKLTEYLEQYVKANKIPNPFSHADLENIIGLVKERCYVINDIVFETSFFFQQPDKYDKTMIEKLSATTDLKKIVHYLLSELEGMTVLGKEDLEKLSQNTVQQFGIKKGELMTFLRYVLVGEKRGVGVLDIACIIGKEELKRRLERVEANV